MFCLSEDYHNGILHNHAQNQGVNSFLELIKLPTAAGDHVVVSYGGRPSLGSPHLVYIGVMWKPLHLIDYWVAVVRWTPLHWIDYWVTTVRGKCFQWIEYWVTVVRWKPLHWIDYWVAT